MCEEQNEKDNELFDSIGELLEKTVELVKLLAQQLEAIIKPILDMWSPIIAVVKVKHGRVYHLAIHGRTERIRKKNQKRLFEIIFKKKGGGLYAERLVGESK